MFTGLDGNANQSLARTSIDKLFMQELEGKQKPGEVKADDPLFFRQDSLSNANAVIDEEIAPPGEFNSHQEEQEYENATIRSGNRVAHDILNFKRAVPISEEFFEDDQHNAVPETIRALAARARSSRDRNAFESSYGDAFSGATVNEGTAMVSNSHTNLNGDTIDNLETGALNADNLFTLIKSLRLQKAHDGDPGDYDADGLLVPFNLHKTAVEVADSELASGTADNDLNYFSNVYPGMRVGNSIRLDSTYNSLNSNADTSYFVVDRRHTVMRTVRKALETNLIPPDTDPKGRYFYRARFREEVHPVSYSGVAGSNGTV